jgi:hypothetical protein
MNNAIKRIAEEGLDWLVLLDSSIGTGESAKALDPIAIQILEYDILTELKTLTIATHLIVGNPDWEIINNTLEDQVFQVKTVLNNACDFDIVIKSALGFHGEFESLLRSHNNEEECRVLGSNCANCIECVAAAKGWSPAGELPDIGDCCTWCNCIWEFKGIFGEMYTEMKTRTRRRKPLVLHVHPRIHTQEAHAKLGVPTWQEDLAHLIKKL